MKPLNNRFQFVKQVCNLQNQPKPIKSWYDNVISTSVEHRYLLASKRTIWTGLPSLHTKFSNTSTLYQRPKWHMWAIEGVVCSAEIKKENCYLSQSFQRIFHSWSPTPPVEYQIFPFVPLLLSPSSVMDQTFLRVRVITENDQDNFHINPSFFSVWYVPHVHEVRSKHQYTNLNFKNFY